MNPNNLNWKIENMSETVQDPNPPTVTEQTILNEIQDISTKISSKKTFNLNSLGNYAQILKTLEENRNRFIEGDSIDLKPLQSFALSADQLTCYMQSLIQRFHELSNINNTGIMSDIYANIDKINKFVNTSENLFQMMEKPDQFEWYNKYNDTVLSIQNSMNAYEKVAKQITYQLSDPVNYVNPQIKGLTELFNKNYINNPLPQNFLSQNHNQPSIQSLPSLETKITSNNETQNVSSISKPPTEISQSKKIKTILIVYLVIIVIGILFFILYMKFWS
jgi:preprotein translocase subunit Sss1